MEYMDRIINNLVKTENEAGDIVAKARYDKSISSAQYEKEFAVKRKSKYQEIDKMLESERKLLKQDDENRLSALETKHKAEKERLIERYQALSKELVDQLFDKVIEL